jgi:hypothetical protein
VNQVLGGDSGADNLKYARDGAGIAQRSITWRQALSFTRRVLLAGNGRLLAREIRAAIRAVPFPHLHHSSRIAACAALALFGLLPGCSLITFPLRVIPHPWKKPPKATLKTDQLMGTITMVNEESSFVLVDSGTLPSPVVGTFLKARNPDGTVAQLRVTEVRKPPFYVADIVKGMPAKGQSVYQ